MNQFNTNVAARPEMDLGLRSFMLGTYRWMAMAMAVTAVVAYFVGQWMIANPASAQILYSPFVLLGFVIGIPVLFGGVGRKLPTMSMGGVLTFLFGFAAILGVFMAGIAAYADPAIAAKIFFMTVAMFGGLSIFGYTTERNLSAFIKYAFIAFAAYVVIMVAGMFFPAIAPSGTLEMVITAVALGAIAMIVAWETQMLKNVYYSLSGDTALMNKYSAFGAASLLLAFVNMFQLLMALFGRD